MTSVLKKQFCGFIKSGLVFTILFFVVTITIYGPLDIYISNQDEFWFSIKDMGKIAVLAVLCSFVLLSFVGFLLPQKGQKLFSCLLFTLTLGLYIQGNYANIDYGILDGNKVEWSSHTLYGFVDTFGWIILFVLFLFLFVKKRNLLLKIQKWGSVFLIMVQVVSLFVLMLTSDISKEQKTSYYLSDEYLYEISSNDNVIIFVLDAFDDQYMQEILAENPEKYNKIFKDFVHYDNNAAGGAQTKLGMPAIILGRSYPGEITYSEYISKYFDSDDLYTTLHNKNYSTCLYTEYAFVPESAGNVVANHISSGYKVSSYPDITAKYMQLTMYRFVPHFLKQYFWLYTEVTW